MYILNFYQGRELKIAGIPIDGRITIGRDLSNVVRLSDSSVSRRHATIFIQKAGNETQVILRDEGSTNGCEVNNNKLKNASACIKPEDHIEIGTFRVELAEKVGLDFFNTGDDFDHTIIYEGSSTSRSSLPIDRLRSLYDFSSKVSHLDTEQLLAGAALTLSSCLYYDVLCILLQKENGLQVVRTWKSSGVCQPSEVSVSRRILEKCLSERIAILTDKKQSGSAQKIEDSTVWKTLSSALCVPLIAGERLLGAVYVGSQSPTAVYNKDDLQFLNLVASNLAGNLLIRQALQDLQAEAEKTEAILRNLREGVLVADGEFNILSANKAARRIFGDMTLEKRRLQDVLRGFRHTFHQRPFPGCASFQLETLPQGGDKGTGPMIYAATVSENDASDQDAWRYVICFHDVTQVERNERMKSMFINRLAHKLRTPLTIIMGVNSLLAEKAGELEEPEVRKLLSQCVKHSEECAALIERFLEYTSLNLSQDTGFAPLDLFYLDDILTAAVELNRDLIETGHFTVSRRFPEETFVFQGLETNLRLAFHHIVQNAAKFGKERGTLEINASEAGGMIKIKFLDNGPGIPSAQMDYLFQMLHQVDLENTGEVPGAGLGLWIAREIIQAHGGNIQIVSPADEKGGGTLVEVLLPAAPKVNFPSLEPVRG